jgi:hypothetical protein
MLHSAYISCLGNYPEEGILSQEEKNTKIHLQESLVPGISAYGLIHLVGHQHVCVPWNEPMQYFLKQ